MEQKWAYFKKQEYQDFVLRFAEAQTVLVPLIDEGDESVGINLDELSSEQRDVVGEEAYLELRSHVHRWYVIHTYSGYEKVVKENLEQRLRSLGLAARVSEVLIPTEDVMEVKGGKKTGLYKTFISWLCVCEDGS
jgi:transcriptional antiterminator NusG